MCVLSFQGKGKGVGKTSASTVDQTPQADVQTSSNLDQESQPSQLVPMVLAPDTMQDVDDMAIPFGDDLVDTVPETQITNVNTAVASPNGPVLPTNMLPVNHDQSNERQNYCTQNSVPSGHPGPSNVPLRITGQQGNGTAVIFAAANVMPDGVGTSKCTLIFKRQ